MVASLQQHLFPSPNHPSDCRLQIIYSLEWPDCLGLRAAALNGHSRLSVTEAFVRKRNTRRKPSLKKQHSACTLKSRRTRRHKWRKEVIIGHHATIMAVISTLQKTGPPYSPRLTPPPPANFILRRAVFCLNKAIGQSETHKDADKQTETESERRR